MEESIVISATDLCALHAGGVIYRTVQHCDYEFATCLNGQLEDGDKIKLFVLGSFEHIVQLAFEKTR